MKVKTEPQRTADVTHIRPGQLGLITSSQSQPSSAAWAAVDRARRRRTE